jgi:hypothetical protein
MLTPETQTLPAYQPTTDDWLLDTLVRLVNSTPDAAFGITLNVAGVIVSGHLISGRDYMERLGRDLTDGVRSSGTAPEHVVRIVDGFNKLGETQYGGEIDQQPPAGYIHLRDAIFFAPNQGQVSTLDAALWRGKLASVDGFAFGVLR